MNETIFQVNLSLFSVDCIKQAAFQMENQFQIQFLETNKEYVKLNISSENILPQEMQSLFQKELIFVSVTQTTFEKSSDIRNALAQTALSVTDKEYNRYKETLKKLVKSKVKEKYNSNKATNGNMPATNGVKENELISLNKLSDNTIHILFSDRILIPDIMETLKSILQIYESPTIEIDTYNGELKLHLVGDNALLFAEEVEKHFLNN